MPKREGGRFRRKVNVIGWARGLNRWMVAHKDALAAWSSIVAIVSLPAAAVGVIVGWHQIRDLLTRPSVELEFRHPSSVTYEVVNGSDRLAEDVLISFGLADLDSDMRGPVQIPSVAVNYLNRRSRKGPFSFLQQFGAPGHRYFGIVYLGCKGCDELKTYWLYARHGEPRGNFYANRQSSDTFRLDVGRIAADSGGELAALVPEARRVYIGE